MTFTLPLTTLIDQLQNPTNVILLGVLGYLLYPILTASNKLPDSWSKVPRSHLESYSWMPEKLPEAVVWRSYTPRQLRAFDGTANPTAPILFAIRGKIYDVTAGRGFYGPGGPYGNFAGRDASRGLAKQSFEMDMLTPLDAPIDDLSDLTESERVNLREWELHFQNKYFQCGDFVEEP